MRFVIIDYSKDFQKNKAAQIISPKRNGKFIQVRKATVEYLVLSPKESSVYHSDIAERFLTEKGIAGRYNDKGDLYEISDPGWKITGGGFWSIDENEKIIQFFGSSRSYGKFDRRGLRDKLIRANGFLQYTISVE